MDNGDKYEIRKLSMHCIYWIRTLIPLLGNLKYSCPRQSIKFNKFKLKLPFSKWEFELSKVILWDHRCWMHPFQLVMFKMRDMQWCMKWFGPKIVHWANLKLLLALAVSALARGDMPVKQRIISWLLLHEAICTEVTPKKPIKMKNLSITNHGWKYIYKYVFCRTLNNRFYFL